MAAGSSCVPAGAALVSWTLLACALCVAAPAIAARSSLAATDRAAILFRDAQRRLAENTVDGRHAAIDHLEQALRLAPDRIECLLLLGHAQELSGYYSEAHFTFHRVTRVAPQEPEAYAELGAFWKREWLKYLEPALLDSARAACEKLVKLRPYSCDGWLALAPLRYESGDLEGAADAADHARRARPGRADAAAAAACLAYRRGELERADSLFRAAIPRLPKDVRALYDDIAPVAADSDLTAFAAIAPAQRAAFLDAFWSRVDPDPTTAENEARLEYWSRATHAWLLFRDPLQPALDARTQIYMRYGPPRHVAYNPLGERLWFKFKEYDPQEARSGGRTASWQEYPLNALVWEYPEVGMRIVLQDRRLDGTYDFPFERAPDPRSTPNRELLARRSDLIATGAGRGLFPTLPPRAQRLDVRGMVAHFGERGSRLLAQVDAPASPADSVYGRWVIQDAAGREVARGAGPFATSACDPTERRVTELSADLAPGDYVVIVSARDGRRRGLYRAPAHIEPPSQALAMSDVVLTCGTAGAFATPGAIRIDADLGGVVADRAAVSAYFELYGLAPGKDGVARFEYQYLIQPAESGKSFLQRVFSFVSPPNVVTVQREEIQRSSMRRQFVSVPVQSLGPGRYRLEVRIKDLVTGARAAGSTRFEKLAPATAGDALEKSDSGGMR